MKIRDWALVASGAVLPTGVSLALYLARAEPEVGREALQPLQHAGSERAPEREVDRAPLPLTASPVAPEPSAAPRTTTEPSVARQLDRVRSKLEKLQREKGDLEAQVRALEGELAQPIEGVSAGAPHEFELDRDDWKELAAEHRIKYRIPCLMPADNPWPISPAELDKLGLSPEDGEVMQEAHLRSNARVWATVRPLCLKAVGDAHAVDLLGAMECLRVIEQEANKADLTEAVEARRHVGEVHAGMRPPPEPGQPQHPVFEAYMAVTSEAKLFEADLAEAFGPEEAKRVAQNMSCVAARNYPSSR